MDDIPSLLKGVLSTSYRHFCEMQQGGLRPWESPQPLVELLAGRDGDMPLDSTDASEVIEFILNSVQPYSTGNVSPKFFGWVHGGGHELGIAAAIVATAMNSNVGGRNHGAVAIEATVLGWFYKIFGFTGNCSGVFTQGTSEANVLALATARTSARSGVHFGSVGAGEAIYVGVNAHESVHKAARILQYAHVRTVPAVDAYGRINAQDLEEMICADRQAGIVPVCVVATAGAVDSGACDNLEAIATVCAQQRIWMHTDGAFGAWLRIAPPPFDEPVRGIELSDSIAFDLHKWLPIPFAAAALITRNGEAHRATFATDAPYLAEGSALASGPDWATNFGIALSRPFHGLAPYVILRALGVKDLGRHIAYCVVLADYFGSLVQRAPHLGLALPVIGNVVLFHAIDETGTALDPDLVAGCLQESGNSVFSTTSLNGRRVLRACFVNHTTRPSHVDSAVVEIGAAISRLGELNSSQ